MDLFFLKQIVDTDEALKDQPLLDGYLDVYQGLCSVKRVCNFHFEGFHFFIFYFQSLGLKYLHRLIIISGRSQRSDPERKFCEKGSGERGEEPWCCGSTCGYKEAMQSWVRRSNWELKKFV